MGRGDRLEKNMCEINVAKGNHIYVGIRPGSKYINENSCIECQNFG